MRKFAVILVLLASCAGPTPQELQKQEIRGAFEAWRDVTAAGDVAANFAMLSDAMKSQWLFRRLQEDGDTIREWRGRLTGTARTDLDLWLVHNQKRKVQRADLLPPSVRADPWLLEVYTEFFKPNLAALKAQFSRLSVQDIATDATGTTVRVGNADRSAEMYQMIYERDGWKIDGHLEPRRSIPR